MATPVLQTDVYTDFQGLSELRARAKRDSDASLREVAGQFEALFMQMMLKSMRDANLGEGIFDNEHTRTYQAMFDKQIAIDLSQRSGLGLAEILVRQLSRSDSAPETESAATSPAAPKRQVPLRLPSRAAVPTTIDAAQTRPPTGSDWKPDSAREFVGDLWPHAKRAADELGTRPELLLAQAALETGWGRHVIRGTDGRNSFNLFNIKADSRWQGDRVTTETVEFRDGLMRRERANFRAYESPAESFGDYVEFIKANPRYREALKQAADAPAFARALSAAGYATDPEYSQKINHIMGSERLRDAVSEIKESGFEPLS
jgi:flagellar protein FlgJ